LGLHAVITVCENAMLLAFPDGSRFAPPFIVAIGDATGYAWLRGSIPSLAEVISRSVRAENYSIYRIKLARAHGFLALFPELLQRRGS